MAKSFKEERRAIRAARGSARVGRSLRPRRLLGDDRLAQLAAQGDREAFAAIYSRHHQCLFRYCRSILGNDEEARDALQSTMTKALASLPGERRTITLKPWLFRVAHNEALTIIRRRRPAVSLDEGFEVPVHDVDSATRERLRSLFADLTHLPERQRNALLMRELGGLEYGEVAAALGTSEAAARQTVHEARTSLHELAGGREMHCDTVRRRISKGDGRLLRGRRMSAHLRSCQRCSSFNRAITAQRHDLGALAPPIGALAAAGLLERLLGPTGGAAAGAAAGAGGGGAGLTGLAGGGGLGGLVGGAALGTPAAKIAIASAISVAIGAGAIAETNRGRPVADPDPVAARAQAHDEGHEPSGRSPDAPGRRHRPEKAGGPDRPGRGDDAPGRSGRAPGPPRKAAAPSGAGPDGGPSAAATDPGASGATPPASAGGGSGTTASGQQTVSDTEPAPAPQSGGGGGGGGGGGPPVPTSSSDGPLDPPDVPEVEAPGGPPDLPGADK